MTKTRKPTAKKKSPAKGRTKVYQLTMYQSSTGASDWELCIQGQNGLWLVTKRYLQTCVKLINLKKGKK